MSFPRSLLALVILLLSLPLLWPRPGTPQDAQTLPVQARLQADLAARLVRLVDLEGTRLPAEARQGLEQSAAAMLDQGLAQRPSSPDLTVRRALLAARAGDAPEALRLVSALAAEARTPEIQALERAWRGRAPVRDPGWAIHQHLGGYYRYLALVETHQVEAAQALLAGETIRAQKDLSLLGLLGTLTMGSLALGLLAWLALPWLARRPILPRRMLPPTDWDPLGAVALLVGFQWLAPLIGSRLFLALRALGLSQTATGVMTQILVYLLALGALVRMLPRLARSKTASGLFPTLGLSRPRPADLAAGLVGFWMAIPAVLVASWVTSSMLGHSPFSSNPALEMILRASAAELVALGVMAALAGPFFEEVLFRGVLFAGLRAPLSPWGAGLVSALLFALVHGDPQALLVLTALGAIFAALYHKTGSLWPAVVAHGLWNGATVAAMALVLVNR